MNAVVATEPWSDIPDSLSDIVPDIPDTDRTWFSDMIGHTIGHQSDIDRTLIGQYRTIPDTDRTVPCASLSSPRPDIPDIPDIPASSRPLKRQGLPDGPVRVS